MLGLHLTAELSWLEGYVSTAVQREEVREDIESALQRIRALLALPREPAPCSAEPPRP